jgi:hypothetical protein
VAAAVAPAADEEPYGQNSDLSIAGGIRSRETERLRQMGKF